MTPQGAGSKREAARSRSLSETKVGGGGRVNGCMCGSAVPRSPMSFAEDKQRAASSDAASCSLMHMRSPR